MKNWGTFLLHQSLDRSKFPKNLLLITFLDIQTHPFLPPIFTGFISSVKISVKNLLVVKTFSMVILLIFFLALEYWLADIPYNAIYDVSSRHWNSYFSVARGLAPSIMVSATNAKHVEFYWQIKPLIFSSHQNLDSLKISDYAFAFDLSRHAKWHLTAPTGLISFTKITTKRFPLLKRVSTHNFPFRSLQLTSGSPKKSRSFIQNGVFSVSKARFPNNY